MCELLPTAQLHQGLGNLFPDPNQARIGVTKPRRDIQVKSLQGWVLAIRFSLKALRLKFAYRLDVKHPLISHAPDGKSNWASWAGLPCGLKDTFPPSVATSIRLAERRGDLQG